MSIYRADDAPPYFTIVVVGHVIVPLILLTEKTTELPVWIHAAIWLPATTILTLALLPRIKGAVLGVLWALKVET